MNSGLVLDTKLLHVVYIGHCDVLSAESSADDTALGFCSQLINVLVVEIGHSFHLNKV